MKIVSGSYWPRMDVTTCDKAVREQSQQMSDKPPGMSQTRHITPSSVETAKIVTGGWSLRQAMTDVTECWDQPARCWMNLLDPLTNKIGTAPFRN